MKNLRTKWNNIIVLGICLLLVAVSLGIGTRTITDTSDTVYTKITTSLGGVYDATQVGLQDAFNSLNNLTGWIHQPGNSNITLTSTLYIGANAEYDGGGGILYLQTNANTTMIKNYGCKGWVSGSTSALPIDKNIKIHHLRIEGNGYNQPAYVVNNNQLNEPNGITFIKTENITISDMRFDYIAYNCLRLWKCRDVIIYGCQFFNWGPLFDEETPSSSGYFAYTAAGIFSYNSSNVTISKCIGKQGYASFIIIEGQGGTAPYIYDDHNVVISDCQAYDTHIGFYLEDAHDVNIINCIATNCNTYVDKLGISPGGCQPPEGFLTASSANNIQITNCISKYNGNVTTKGGNNYNILSHNSSLMNCLSVESNGNGTRLAGLNCKMIGCTSLNETKVGILVYNNNPIVSGNTIIKAGSIGISVGSNSPTTNKHAIISNNIINTTGTYGISCDLDNFTITSNSISHTPSNAISITARFGIVSNNVISWGAYAIDLSGSSFCNNVTVTSNNIFNATRGINIGSTVSNATIGFNRIRATSSAMSIYEYTGAKYNIYIGNNVLGGGTMYLNGVNNQIMGNQGYSYMQCPTSAPATPRAGSVYVNTTTGLIGVYSGSAWLWH